MANFLMVDGPEWYSSNCYGEIDMLIQKLVRFFQPAKSGGGKKSTKVYLQ
jgi:hypothetical protein